MKKIALASVAALGLGFGSVAPASAAKLALVISTLNNPFFVTLQQGAQAQAKAQGDELIVLDSGDDPAKELSNVEDALSQGVDLLLLNPTDSDAAASSVRSANGHDVPVITLDRSANGGKVVAHIASDNVAGGKLAAQFIADRLEDDGKVIQLEGVPGASATRDRGQGFSDELKQHKDIELVASQPANFNRSQGLDVTENLLQAHPDIDAVFAQNDEMALGAQRAISASGRDVLLVGFDGTAEGMKAVDEGQMAATVAQQPDQIGKLGVETAHRVLSGEKVDKNIPVELKLYTGE